MKYNIQAPDMAYDRKIAGLQFVNGEAVTENRWLASWFSGRDGFIVVPLESDLESGKEGEGKHEGKSSAKGGKPSAGNPSGNA